MSSDIIRTLQERDWVRVVGYRDVPGKPALYATTKNFLDYFNIKNLEQLPALSEIKDFAELDPELELALSGTDKASAPVAANDEEGTPPQDFDLQQQTDGVDEESAEIDTEINTDSLRSGFNHE